MAGQLQENEGFQPIYDFTAAKEQLRNDANSLAALMPLLSGDRDGETSWCFGRDLTEDPSQEDFQRELVEGYETKRLVVCCDGTWQNASGSVSPMTNVAKLARAVDRLGKDDYKIPERDDTAQTTYQEANGTYGLIRQVVYYSSGVGTQSSLQVDSGFSGMTGKGVTAGILSAYCFICNNFNGGTSSSIQDEIILVGFSRGAFTVRCLANFIDKVGLLRRKGLPFLWTVYTSWKKWGEAKSGQRKEKRKAELDTTLLALQDIRISGIRVKVLAEWDTVSAMGLPLGFWKERLSFVNEEVPASVENAFYALALDERRPSFKPRQWTRRADNETNIEQCAFVGCHSDIGGGNPDVGLSTISLIWMISRIREVSEAGFDSGTYLQFMAAVRPLRFGLGISRSITPAFWKSKKMQLKNFADTKGQIHESLSGWWLIPHLLSLTLWQGRRSKALDHDEEAFRMEVHFTVPLLQNMHCRLNKHYEFNHETKKWVKRGAPDICLSEATVFDEEKRLLEKWINIARLWQNLSDGGQNLREGEEDWTEIADGLEWTRPSSNIQDSSLVRIIEQGLAVLDG